MLPETPFAPGKGLQFSICTILCSPPTGARGNLGADAALLLPGIRRRGRRRQQQPGGRAGAGDQTESSLKHSALLLMLASDLFHGQQRQNIGLAVFGSPGFAATTPQESAGCSCSAPVPRAAHTAGAFVLRKYPKASKKILSEASCCWRLSPG